jgi:hypothetical protein
VIKYVFVSSSITQHVQCTYCVNKSDPETVKLKLAAPILDFGTIKPSGAVPLGRTVKASTNIQLVRIGLVNSVDCEHGYKMGWFVPPTAAWPVAQVGRIIVHCYYAKRRLNTHILLVYVYILCIYV